MPKLVSKLDDLIRRGKIPEVMSAVGKLNLARVQRSERQGLAKICRRVGMIDKGLRVLQPIVRHKLPLDNEPTQGEICEYAVLLSRTGCWDEALGLLATVDPTEMPEALLYEGFIYVSKWDYARAANLFERFYEQAPDDYTKLIARVNLSSALVETGRWQEAEGLINAIIESANKTGSTRLIGNAYELMAQVHIGQGRSALAQQSLNEALAIFRNSESYDRLLVEKWYAFMAAQRASSLEPLLEFRQRAVIHRHWHSVREADFLSLKINFEQSLFDHLFFGSPFTAYRERLLHTLQKSASPTYQLGHGEGEWLDLLSGESSRGEELKIGSQVHKVFSSLASDLYEPSNIGRLFSLLFAGEYLDVDSSPLRVRQALKRTRRWLEERRFPVDLKYESGGYRISMHGNFALQLHQEAPQNFIGQADDLLRRAFPSEQKFSMREAINAIGCSRTTFHRLAKQAIADGRWSASGTGKATRYCIPVVLKIAA